MMSHEFRVPKESPGLETGDSIPATPMCQTWAMGILTELQREAFAASHPAWTEQGDTISRTFTFEDFAEAMGFVTRVGVAAERAFHHPDIDIRWNKVTLSLTSHDVGGLTERDIELAARIDSFFD